MEANGDEQIPQKDPRTSILSNRVAKIDGEHGISKLERDGKLECSYTWTIKRDMFDMPMLFVINVSKSSRFIGLGVQDRRLMTDTVPTMLLPKPQPASRVTKPSKHTGRGSKRKRKTGH